MECAITNTYPQAYHVLCMWHILQDLMKHSISTLKSNFQEFRTDFQSLFYIRSKQVFDTKLAQIFSKYGLAGTTLWSYIERRLLPRSEKWGGPWVGFIFNLGLRTNQLVEMTNRLLKRLVDIHDTLEETISAVLEISESQVDFHFFFLLFLNHNYFPSQVLYYHSFFF